MKPTQFLYHKSLFCTLFFLFAAGWAWGQDDLAGWTFPSAPTPASTVIPAECGVFQSSSNIYMDGTNGSSSVSGITGYGGHTPIAAYQVCSVSANTQSLAIVGTVNNNKGIVFKFPTIGYEKLKLSYSTRGTGTGYTTHSWSYSTNGTSFTNFATITGRTNTSFSTQTVDFSSITAIDNKSNVYIKVTISGASDSGGNNRFDNIKFYATEAAPAGPTLTTSPTEISGLDYILGNGPSASDSFVLSGANLDGSDDIMLLVDTGFEISLDESSWDDELTIPNYDGSNTTVYVRLQAGLGINNYSGIILLGGYGTDAEVDISGSVTAPTPSTEVSVSTLSGFTYVLGNGPSASQSFTVQGSNLTSNITVSAPTNYQVSLNSGSGYQNSLNLTPVGGEVGTTTVFTRLNSGLGVGNYNGNITVFATGTGNKTIALTGSVTCSVITSFPFTETFENSSPTRDCWSQIQETGTASWTYQTGAGGGSITSAQEGSLNARFVSQSGNLTPVTKLVSPVMNLSSLSNPTVSFYYGQELWISDQNELKVYYRTSTSGPWVEIAHYADNISTWTKEQLNLPNPTATYQIAFEGINDYGRANVLDNVRVYSMETCSAPLAQPTGLTFSSITNNSISGSFIASDADKYLIIISTSSFLSTNPSDGTVYTTGQTLGNGTVVQSSDLTTFTANDLTADTEYYFFIFALNDVDCFGGPVYLLNSPLTGSETTLEEPAAKIYTLVTDASQLQAGARYLIVNKYSSVQSNIYAVSNQTTNNRAQSESLTIVNSGGNMTITVLPADSPSSTAPFEFILGGSAGSWTFQDVVNGGFLHPVSSSNYLRNATGGGNNYNWSITIANAAGNYAATIATTTDNRTIRYNSSSSLFSAYTTGQAAVYLYKEGSVVPIATHFRSKTNGSWTSSSTWESSADGINWYNATSYPDADAESVVILSGNTVNIDSPSITITNTEVYGAIEVLNSNYGVTGNEDVELIIKNGGELIVNGSGYANSGTSFGLIETGGKIIARNLPNVQGAGSDFVDKYLEGLNGLFYFQDGAICEWDCATTTLGTSGFTTIFRPAQAGDIAILRFTSEPPSEYTMGSPTSSVFNSILELTDGIEINISGSGQKTFVGGIRGEGVVDVYSASGNLNLGTINNVPEMGGDILLRVPSAKLKLPNGGNVTAGANFVIERSDNTAQNGTIDRTGGTINVNGILDITNMRITNTATGGININNGGTIRTRHTVGLFGNLSAIVNDANLFLNEGSTVDYYAAENQAISSGKEYYHIIFSGDGTKTPGSNINVNTNGSVTITGTPTVDFSTNNLASTSSNTTAFTMDGGRLILGTTLTQPNMMGTYNLSGGVVEFANSGATVQTIRNTPNYKYQNIEISGTNVGNSSGNIALRPNGTFKVNGGGIFTIRQNSIKCYNAINGQDLPGTGCGVTVENNAIFRTGNAQGFSGTDSAFGPESSSIDKNITNITLSNGSTVDYLGEKPGGQDITLDTGFVPGNTSAHYSNLTISGDVKNELTGTLVVDNVLEIKDHTNGANSYTGKLVVAASGNSDPTNVVYANKGVKVTSGDFTLKNNAQLMQDASGVTNTGNISVEKQFVFSTERKQYNFLSVPVTNPGRFIRFTVYNPNPLSVQMYNESNYYFYETDGTYTPGKGYAVQESSGTTDQIGRFLGTPNNGNSLSFTLKKSTPAGGFNLTGNPYPSNLNLNQLYTDNSDYIEPTFYFWDNRGNTEFNQQGSGYNGDHYAKYNATNETGSAAAIGVPTSYETRIPTNEVKIGTGFMVQVKTNLGNGDYNLNFNNTQRITTNSGPGFFGKGQNFDQPQKDRYWLTMTTPGEIRVMNAVVYFDGGNDEFWLDDTESFEGSDDLYTINDGHKLSIQGRAPFRINDVLPLGYKAFAPGTHILSVYQKEGIFAESQDIWLVDMLLNKTVNLSKKPYKFVTRAGEYGNRFKIVYRPSFQTGVDISANDISMLKVGQQIVISSTIDRISEVEVFDLNSRPVFKKNEINRNKFSVNASSFNHQILIIKVKTETGETVTRKFVMN